MGPRRKVYMAMLEKGLSCEEIAKKCGVSKQAVYSSIRQYKRPAAEKKREARKRYITGVENQVIYVNIADFLVDNDITVSALANMCDISPSTMLKAMKGEVALRKNHIDSLIKVTGLPYEELFEE